MDVRRTLPAVLLAVGLTVAGGSVVRADAGHNHGEAEGPTAGLEDVAIRASTVGQHFQLVALPKDGRLVIFLDHADSNAPAIGARIEILAGDALVTAEEVSPGLYMVEPWPAEGVPAEAAESVELVATVVSADREEVLLARMSGVDEPGLEGRGHAGDSPGAKGGRAAPQRVALWDGVKPLVLPVSAGLLALLGAIAAVRSSGRRRWLGVALSGAGIATMIAATSLV